MCAVSYVLLVDEVERRALTMLTVAAIAASAGNRVEFVDPVQARADFDAALTAGPVEVDADQLALIRALGLGGA